MSKKLDSAIVLRETANIVDSQTLLRTPVKELTADALVSAWSVLELFEKNLFGPRKKEMRDALLDLAEKNGEKDVKGSYFLDNIPGTDGTVKKEHRSGKVSFDEVAIEAMMKKKLENSSISRKTYDSIFKPTRVFDPEAFEAAFKNGLITERELKSVSSVGDSTYALKVKKPSEVSRLIKK